MSLPDKAYCQIFDADNEVIQLGTYQPGFNGQLKYIYVDIFIHGTMGGSERVRTHVYGDSLYSSAIASSDWFSLADLSFVDTYCHGFMQTVFSSQYQLDSSVTYYIGLEIDNYTRNSLTYFVGAKWDYPEPIYGNKTSLMANMPFRFLPLLYKSNV